VAEDPKKENFQSVFCAVNHFGQDTYYKLPEKDEGKVWNGLCHISPRSRVHEWDN